MNYIVAIVYVAGVVAVFATVDPLPLVLRTVVSIAWPVLVIGSAVVAIVDRVRGTYE